MHNFLRNIVLVASVFALSNILFAQEVVKNHVITEIVFDGLKVTKKQILDREVTFDVGDTLGVDNLNTELDRSIKNLQNLGLFISVLSNIIHLEGDNVMILFTVRERYYTLPVPIFKFEEPNFSTWWKDKNFERTSYGLELFRRNFRGRNETVGVTAQLGFTKKVSLSYTIPYINKKQKIGLYFRTFYNQNNDVSYATVNNERVFFKDKNEKSREEKFASAGLLYRRALYHRHEMLLTFRNVKISDSLQIISPTYLLNGKNEIDYFTMVYRWTNSFTDNDSYPLKGQQTTVKLTKFGLGVFGDDFNVLTLRPSFKNYSKLANNLWFQTGVELKYSWYKKLPYRLQEGLGFGETFVRGYEFYVVDGQHYSLLRNNLKTTLISQRLVNLPFMKSDKFRHIPFAIYLNAYTDIGYVWDDINPMTNPLSNKLLRGTGLGIDFVAAYDQVIRLEFSVNDKSETGFYLSYSKSI